MCEWECINCGKKQNTIVEIYPKVCRACQEAEVERQVSDYNEMLIDSMKGRC